MQTEENDSCRRQALPEYQFAKVLVGRQKQDIRLSRQSENIRVDAAGCDLCEVDDREASLAESIDDLLVDSFVGDDSHAAGRG